MRTFIEEKNIDYGSKSIYVDVWPYRPEQKQQCHVFVPVVKYPSEKNRISVEKLIEYHSDVVADQRYYKRVFDRKRFLAEERLLESTTEWLQKRPQLNLLHKLANEIKEYFRSNDVYDANRPYYDYAGRTLLHWQILCKKETKENIIAKKYWKPILNRCLIPESRYSMFLGHYSIRTANTAAEQDLQDLLHWAYQEQELTKEAKNKADEKRQQCASDLLTSIYGTVEKSFCDHDGELKTFKQSHPDIKVGEVVVDRQGRTLLHWAVLCRQTEEISDSLVNKQYYLKTDYDFYPLDMAVHLGNVDVVIQLLKQGANPNLYSNYYAVTPLHRAVLMGRLDIVKALLTHSKTEVNIDARVGNSELPQFNHDGCTALFYAARLHYWDIVCLLLEKGAKPNLPAATGETALHHAMAAIPAKIDDLSNKQALKTYKAYRALVYLRSFNAKSLGIYNKGRYSDIVCYDFNRWERPEEVAQSQKAIHVHWNIKSNKKNNNGKRVVQVVHFPGLSKKEKEANKSTNFAWHLNRFYRLIHSVVGYVREIDEINKIKDIKQKNKKQRRQRKITLHAKKQLAYLATRYPDTLRRLILKPLLEHHADPEQASLEQYDKVLLLRWLASKPQKIDILLRMMVSIPRVRNTVLRDDVDVDLAKKLLETTNHYEITWDVKSERQFYDTVVKRAKGLHSVTQRLDQLGKQGTIRQQITDLTFYFKQWRLTNANCAVRFFKSKKINYQRQGQLESLQALLDKKDISDEIRVGNLIKISKDIGKERNVFVSEMKKQVDQIVENYLAENARDDLLEQQPKTKEECIKAYRSYQEQQQDNNFPPSFL